MGTGHYVCVQFVQGQGTDEIITAAEEFCFHFEIRGIFKFDYSPHAYQRT